MLEKAHSSLALKGIIAAQMAKQVQHSYDMVGKGPCVWVKNTLS